jgi:hypothetical protein
MWDSIIERCTSCQLTKLRDKLVVAIAGLAQIIQEESQDEYVAGVWKQNLRS